MISHATENCPTEKKRNQFESKLFFRSAIVPLVRYFEFLNWTCERLRNMDYRKKVDDNNENLTQRDDVDNFYLKKK